MKYRVLMVAFMALLLLSACDNRKKCAITTAKYVVYLNPGNVVDVGYYTKSYFVEDGQITLTTTNGKKYIASRWTIHENYKYNPNADCKP